MISVSLRYSIHMDGDRREPFRPPAKLINILINFILKGGWNLWDPAAFHRSTPLPFGPRPSRTLVLGFYLLRCYEVKTKKPEGNEY